MTRYRIQIWSARLSGLVDHDAIPAGTSGEPLLERIHTARRRAAAFLGDALVRMLAR